MEYAQNIGNNVSGAYERSSTFQKVLTGVVIVLIIYFLYIFFIKEVTYKTILKEHDARTAKKISENNIPLMSDTDYSISVWIYVDQWNHNYGKEKHILGRYLVDGGKYYGSPSITMDAYTNDLKVKIGYSGPTSGSSKYESQECVVKGVPLQKWVCITMSVSNRTLDVYIDGKLSRTCVIKGVPVTPSDKGMFVGSYESGGMGGGFAGYITDLRIFTRSINPTQAYNIYKQGNSMSGLGSMVGRYKFKFSVLDNNKETNEFTFP